MSRINGSGYGDKHDWEMVYSHQWGALGGIPHSIFKCKKCQEGFTHYYHQTPDIFKAMEDMNVKETCNGIE